MMFAWEYDFDMLPGYWQAGVGVCDFWFVRLSSISHLGPDKHPFSALPT